jgi:predicted aspartyl protease
MRRVIAGLSLVLLAAHPAFAESVDLEEAHGVYLVPVRINDAITIPFVLDSGAGDIAVLEDVFKTLLRTRTVTENDFLAPGTYVMADGSKHLKPRFLLHEVRVGNQVVKDVIASVETDKAIRSWVRTF